MSDNYYVIRQRDIIDLLSKNGIEPEDVRTVHLSPVDSWVEVAVRDEKGNRVVHAPEDQAEQGLYVTTTIPVEIRSMYNGEII